MERLELETRDTHFWLLSARHVHRTCPTGTIIRAGTRIDPFGSGGQTAAERGRLVPQ